MKLCCDNQAELFLQPPIKCFIEEISTLKLIVILFRKRQIYIEIPVGFESHNVKNKVCKLKKAICFRAWFGRYTHVMISLGYKQSQGDHTLIIKHSLDGKLTLLLLPTPEKAFLSPKRNMCLICLRETRKLGCKTTGVPIEQNHKIGSDESPPVGEVSIPNISAKIRPDIAYAVSVVNQFMHDPHERHLQAVEKIIHYFVEAEFRAMAHGICKGLWMKIILDDLKVEYDGPMKLFCDNNSAINIAHNLVQHDITKHRDRKTLHQREHDISLYIR
ncbi:hypothetical protein CR513_01262, partial [Mucuna pruriens]